MKKFNYLCSKIIILKKILQKYYFNDKRLFFNMGIKVLLDLIIPLLNVYVLSYIINNIIQKKYLLDYLDNVFLFSFILMICSYFSSIIKEENNRKITIYRQNLFLIPLFQNVFYLPFEDFNDFKIQKQINSAINAAFSEWGSIEQIMKEFIKFFTLSISFLLYYIIIFYLNWKVAVVFLLLSFLSSILGHYSFKDEKVLIEEVFSINKKLDYLFQKSIDPRAGKEIRIFKLNDFLMSISKNERKKRNKLLVTIEKKYIILDIVQQFVIMFEKLLVFFLLIYKYQYSNFEIASIIFYFSIFEQFFLITANLLDSIVFLMKNSTLAGPYFDFMEKSFYINKKNISANYLNNIYLKNVTYRYPDSNREVIKQLNLKINAGEKIAIVGENGEGKTTLIMLILGLLHPTNGKVILNNSIDLSNYNDGIIAPLVTAMFQKNELFPFSIEENITTKLSSETQKNRFFQVLKDTGLFEYINQLPYKEKTYITQLIDDGGIELSGGINQKLHLCRCLYFNSDFIILDEPTSMYDSISEKIFYEQFHELFKDKTLLYISHRLASTTFCDRIIVLKNGKIMEEGTHEELMKNGKIYYQMYCSQQKSYID